MHFRKKPQQLSIKGQAALSRQLPWVPCRRLRAWLGQGHSWDGDATHSGELCLSLAASVCSLKHFLCSSSYVKFHTCGNFCAAVSQHTKLNACRNFKLYSFIDWEASSCHQSNWEALNVLERVNKGVRMSSGRHNLTWMKFCVAGVLDGDRTNRSWSGTSGSISTNTSRQPFSVRCSTSPKHSGYTQQVPQYLAHFIEIICQAFSQIHC